VSDFLDLLVDDIFDNHRSFLPGEACDENCVRRNVQQSILIGGIDEEESALLLSTLPADASSLSLEPLDKGLSGSKVFQAKYETDGLLSKPFVMKVGPIEKVTQEAKAIDTIVAPTIMGIGRSIYRRGTKKALVGQDLVSLSTHAALESLRTRVRRSNDGPDLILRILRDRLGSWYLPRGRKSQMFTLGRLFDPYLKKGPPSGGGFPPPWDDLFDWVRCDTNCGWEHVEPAMEQAKATVATLPKTIVHGDLHTQNVLVDERAECWPIDFGWTRRGSCPLVDLTMLECSLKFLALPMRTELRSLLPIESAMARFEGAPSAGRTPYGEEADRVFRTVEAVRRFGLDDLAIPEAVYRQGLLLMTFALASHGGLNTPYVIASLQILGSVAMGTTM
jgi:hypothetical protein